MPSNPVPRLDLVNESNLDLVALVQVSAGCGDATEHWRRHHPLIAPYLYAKEYNFDVNI
ncbi:MAG TPA: hypothetical protein VIC53_06775 [Wenzhouxiangella sp.]